MGGENCECPNIPCPICHTQKQTLSDRNESKLIERICNLKEKFPHLKVGEIQRPLVIGGFADEVYEAEVEY